MALTKVAWIGRFTGPKGDIAFELLKKVVPHFPNIKFTIVGGPVTSRFTSIKLDNVVMPGFVDDVNQIFAQNDLIIGSGRVPVEAMRYGKPVIAVGENRYIGPINKATIELAKASNFGDCDHLKPWHAEQLISDLTDLISGNIELPLDEYADYVTDYQIETVYSQVVNFYRDAKIHAYLKRFKELPVLTYHRVLTQHPIDSIFNVYVTVAELESQLKSLVKRGFEFITFKDIVNGSNAKKPIILTFDDGYEDNFQHLLALLVKYKAKAVIFALGDRSVCNNYWDMKLGEPEAKLMNDEQLIALQRSGVVEIGSHGLTHQHLPELNLQVVNNEIIQSKKELEALLEEEVVSFAYPYGDFGSREASLVKTAGYSFGVGTVNGPLSISEDLMRIRRISMFPKTKPAQFWRKTSGYYLRYCKFKGKDFG